MISTSASAPAALRPPPVWHAIRPWTPHWTLAVREITSVSATFILSSTLDARAATVTDGTESGLARDRELASSTIPSATSPAVSVLDSHRPILADTDLSVVVNDSTWQRFIMRMHESADEAIVLIHGLHPGRQYDIDIAIGGGMVGRRMVVTNEGKSAYFYHDINKSGSCMRYRRRWYRCRGRKQWRKWPRYFGDHHSGCGSYDSHRPDGSRNTTHCRCASNSGVLFFVLDFFTFDYTFNCCVPLPPT